MPFLRVAACMETCDDSCPTFLHQVEDAVREPTRQRTTYLAVNDGIYSEVAGHQVQAGFQRPSKLQTEPWLFGFLMPEGFQYLRLGLRLDGERVRGYGFAIFAFTCSHETPSCGFCR